MSNFQPLEVVSRGSETQLQVGENLNILNLRDTSLIVRCVPLIVLQFNV